MFYGQVTPTSDVKRYKRMGSSFHDRVCIDHYDTRDLLLRWSGRTAHTRNGRTRPPFTTTELPDLRTAVHEHATFLEPLLTYVVDQLGLDATLHYYKDFIGDLAYPTAVGGGLFKNTPIVIPTLSALLPPQNGPGRAIDPVHSTILARYFPGLSRLLSCVPSLRSGLPSHFRPLLQVHIVLG